MATSICFKIANYIDDKNNAVKIKKIQKKNLSKKKQFKLLLELKIEIVHLDIKSLLLSIDVDVFYSS